MNTDNKLETKDYSLAIPDTLVSVTDAPDVVTDSTRSEEIQAIIDRMPTYWVKWVALCVGVLMGVIILLGFIIQYPDTVDGPVTVTSPLAPVRLVANSSARIHLLRANKELLRSGNIIAYMENGANYADVINIESLLKTLKVGSRMTHSSLPDTLLLGEVSGAYNSFVLAYSQYERLLSTDLYTTMRSNLQQQIKSDEAVIVNETKELAIKTKVMSYSREQLTKDSVLRSVKGMSEQEYRQQHNAHLSLEESQLGLQSSKLMKLSEINRNRMEVQRITVEEEEAREKAYAELVIKKNELMNAINIWKERYLFYTPIDGELEYTGFWRENVFVQSGQELFSIIPNRNELLGEVMIPSYGAGKVIVGQKVNVKINNFPYDEYGLLCGVVKSISRISNKVQTKEGTSDTYLVLVSFPDGIVTNYGKSIPIDFESKGVASIITKRKRLIQRLFDNLKSKSEK